jgi:hypothetical protein
MFELSHILHSLREVKLILVVLVGVLYVLKLFRDMFHPEKP